MNLKTNDIRIIIFLFMVFLMGTSYGQNDLHHRDQSLPCLNKTIHLYTYVVLNAERTTSIGYQELADLIEETNVYFEPICLQFKLCEIDTIEDYSFNALAESDQLSLEMRRKHRKLNRLNLYLVGHIYNGCGFSGLASIATPKNTYSVLQDGCLIAKALAQEFGTVFGLKDTNFGNREELVDGSNCTSAGDEICDTPADPYRKPELFADYIDECEFIYTGRDANGQYYQPLVSNIMSPYYFLSCSCSFTFDQYMRMAETYQNSSKSVW